MSGNMYTEQQLTEFFGNSYEAKELAKQLLDYTDKKYIKYILSLMHDYYTDCNNMMIIQHPIRIGNLIRLEILHKIENLKVNQYTKNLLQFFIKKRWATLVGDIHERNARKRSDFKRQSKLV